MSDRELRRARIAAIGRMREALRRAEFDMIIIRDTLRELGLTELRDEAERLRMELLKLRDDIGGEA